jgi:DnaJ family protein C protein 28
MSVEEHIQQAMREGKFKDLPGKGQPLRLDENPLEDPEWRLAYHILRSSGFTLPWIELRQEIEEEIQAARAVLKLAWAWRTESLALENPPQQVEAEWKQACQTFSQAVAQVNKRIEDYNLQAPNERLQCLKINAGREIEAIMEIGE